MKSALLSSGQRIIKQILDWLQNTKSQAILERWSDVFSDGVVQSELNNMNVLGKDLDPSLLDFFHIRVDTGVAYKGGDRIIIPNSTLTFDSTLPSHTTDNGLGTQVSTPRSTGSKDIPLTAGSINYLYIAYLQSIDDSLFTLHKITNAKQFYAATDGYQITTNTTGVNPNAAVWVFLASIDLTGSNTAIASTISTVNRDNFASSARRIGIQTSNNSRTDRPSSYAIGQEQLFLDDHIKAVGIGTITPNNPHGMTLTDMGVLPLQTVEEHRILEHNNGIIAGSPGVPLPSSSGLFVQRVQVSPGDDFIVVKALVSGEVALVNGLGFDSSVIGVDVTIPFTGKSSGTYDIYFDSVTKLVTTVNTSVAADTTKMQLGTVIWDTTTVGDGNLSVPVERRRFGTTNALQRWVSTSRPPFPFPGQFGYNMDLNKAEYYNGSIWIQYP